MERVHMGDAVMRVPVTFGNDLEDRKNARRPMKGKVVYIHPRGRYHTVEFETALFGPIRESFFGVAR